MKRKRLDREEIQWDAPLPKREDAMIPILSPRAGECVRAIILSDRFLSVPVHYVCGRTQPCLRIKSLCEGCRRKISRKWKGYAAGVDFSNRRLCLIEITPNAVRSCPQLLDSSDLRGWVVSLMRQGTSSCGKVDAALTDWRKRVNHLPEAFDVQAILLKIWEADNKDGTSAVKLSEEGELGL